MGTLKIRTTGSVNVKRKESLKIRTTGRSKKNNGSALGYVGGKIGVGFASIFEGIHDFTLGTVYQLMGDKEYAKYLHMNDVTGGWNERLDKNYNPSSTMRFVGDVSMALGQAIPSVAVGVATGGVGTVAGAIGSTAIGVGYAGRGVTDAVRQTGELGLKENIYGTLTGAFEGATDALLGGAQKAGKAAISGFRQTAKIGAKKIARKTLLGGVLSSAGSEALEEFIQEYADTALLRLTGVNREAEYSLENAMYSALIGGISGGILGGASGTINSTVNIRRGEDIRARGLEEQLIKTADYVREQHLGNVDNWSNVTSDSLKALSASLDAYKKLSDKSGTKAAMLLGEIKQAELAFEASAGVDGIKSRMMSSDEATRAELARTASALYGSEVTAEDIKTNKGDITRRIALESFVSDAMNESKTDMRRAQINEAIAAERLPYIKQSAGWDGQSAAQYRDPKSGKYVFVEPAEDGTWRMAYSPTAVYDENNLMMKDGLDTEQVKKTLAGLADGSLAIGENEIVSGKAARGNVATEKASTKRTSISEDINEQYLEVYNKSISQVSEEDKIAGAKVADFISSVVNMLDRSKITKRRLKIGKITETHGKIIESLMRTVDSKFSIEGYELWIDGTGADHIEVRHGKNGKADYSMATEEIKTLISWVSNNPDSGDFIRDDNGRIVLSERFFNSDNSQAPQIRLEKKIDGDTFYVSECVPDSANKRVYITSAYIKKGSTNQLLNMDPSESPQPTSKTSFDGSATTNSISQNSEKSTENAKKDKRESLAGDEASSEDTAQDAQEGSQARESAESEQEGVSAESEQEGVSEAQRAAEAENASERAPEMSERERRRGYSDKEANAARALVKDFDVMAREKRLAIIEMMRSAESNGAGKSFMKHAAAMIGYWRKGLWIIADNETSEKGFYQAFPDGTRLIAVKPNAKNDKGRSAINTIFVEELAHDIWDRATAKTKDALYKMATEGSTREERVEIRDEYRNSYQKRGLTISNEIIREEIFTHLIAKTLGNEGFLERFDITPGRMTAFKRSIKAVTRMAKCFFGKDKYLYSRCEKMARSLIRVMGEQTALEAVGSKSLRYMTGDANRTFSYDELISKPDMEVTVIRANQQAKLLSNGSIDTSYVLSEIRNKCESIKTKAKKPTYYVNIPEIGENVEIVRKSITHGMIKSSTVKGKNKTKPIGQNALTTARVSLKLPEIMRNAIEVNILDGRGNIDVPFSHVLLGEAAVEDSNGKLEYYVVRLVVEERINQNPILADANILGKLSAANAKKIGATTVGALQNTTLPARFSAPIKHSISDFLNSVKTLSLTNEVFSADVAQKLGITRSVGDLTNDLRYSISKSEKDFDADAFISQAMENGGMVEKSEAKSQTAENAKAELKDAKREARGLRKANDRLANTAIKAQKRSNELFEKNKELEREAKAYERKAKNAEKREAALGERMETEKAKEVKRIATSVKKLINDLSFLVNEATHRKYTAGGAVGSTILSDPAITAFAAYFAKRASAYNIMNKSTRDGVKLLLEFYNPQNPIFADESTAACFFGEESKSFFSSYDPDIAKTIKSIAEGDGDLSLFELQQLGDITRNVIHLYNTYDAVQRKGRNESAKVMGAKSYEAQVAASSVLDGDGEVKGIKRIFKVFKESYLYTVVTPEEVLRDLEHHVKDPVLSTLYREVRLGEAEAGKIRAEILTPITEFLAKKENKEFFDGLRKPSIDFKGVKISTAQAVGIYETSKRQHATQRLFDPDGGIRIYDAERGEVVHVKKIKRDDIKALYASFDATTKEYIRHLEEAMAACKKYKVDTDRAVRGYTNAIDGHYYPISIDDNYFARDITDIRQAMGLEEVVKNKSFNKNTTEGAQAPLFIEDCQRVLERHVFGIGQYAGLYIPLQNFGKVYGAKFDPSIPAEEQNRVNDLDKLREAAKVTKKTSLREYYNTQVWAKKGGKGGLDSYLTKLFADIQRIKPAESSIIDRAVEFIRSGYVNSVFGLNAKIIFTQLASYPAAFRLIDADCLARAFGNSPFSSDNAGAMDKYSRITYARQFEGSNAADGLIEKLSEFGKKTSVGIEFTDRGTIMALYSACQLQIEKDGGAAVGSEANLKAAAELLDNVLLDTQTTSLMSDRSALARDKNEFAKMLSMFRNEAVKSFSNFYGSIGAYIDHKKLSEGDADYGEMLSEDREKIARNAVAYLGSSAVVAAVSIAFGKLRSAGKPEDEKEKIGAMIAEESVGMVFDLFPIFSDVAGFMMDGYAMDSIPLEVINDVLSSLRNTKVLFDPEATSEAKAKHLRDTSYTVGKVFGLPVRNAARIAETTVGIFNKPLAYKFHDKFDTSKSYKSDLDNALEKGNTRLAQTIMTLWVSDKMTGKASEAAVGELTRLYALSDGDGNKIFKNPRTVPSTLSKKERAKFMTAYSGADGAVGALLSSNAYKELDDAGKAQALKACFDLYYVKGQQACNLEVSESGARLALALGELDENILYAVMGFANSYKGEYRKAHIVQYLISLGVGLKERDKYLAALGYKVE